MSQLSQTVVQELKKIYSGYYDIEEMEENGPLKAICSYHSRDSRYVLVKSAELWAAENHEYLYLWDVGHLDSAVVQEIYQRVLSDGEPRIKPHAQHMSTYLTAVVLYESADRDALEQLKRLKKRRDFRLSLHGWMEFRIAAADISAAGMTTNRAGKVMEKDLSRMVGRIIENHKGEEKTQ